MTNPQVSATTSYHKSKSRGNDANATVSNVSPAEEGWPDPVPLPDELTPVLPLDFSMLPQSVRPFIEDVAERMQCPADFPAVGIMIVLSGVVGRKVCIRPKKYDDWTVVPNLWGVAIGRPGLMKTPAIDEPLKFLKRLEIEAKKMFDTEMEKYCIEEMVGKLAHRQAESTMSKALKNGEDAHSIAAELLSQKKDIPTRTRYVVTDSTVEKLGEILNENPNGVTLVRDELYGWLRTLEKDGHESARGFYLEAWNGNGRYSYDRIGRGNIDIEAAVLSLIGSIQPGRLMEYVRVATQGGAGDDGLLQRLQLAVWPDCPGPWRNVDRWPDSQAKQSVFDVINNLSRLDASSVGAEFEGDISFLRFDHEAQQVFDTWRCGLEQRLRSDELHPALESHLAKYRSLIPSFAYRRTVVGRILGKGKRRGAGRIQGTASVLASRKHRVAGRRWGNLPAPAVRRPIPGR